MSRKVLPLVLAFLVFFAACTPADPTPAVSPSPTPCITQEELDYLHVVRPYMASIFSTATAVQQAVALLESQPYNPGAENNILALLEDLRQLGIGLEAIDAPPEARQTGPIAERIGSGVRQMAEMIVQFIAYQDPSLVPRYMGIVQDAEEDFALFIEAVDDLCI